MKTTCLLLSSVLLLGCLSACNIFTQKQKALKTNDGSITTVETGGNELTVCDFALAKDTIDVPLSEFVEDCRIIRFDNSDSAMFKAWFTLVTDQYIGVRQRSGGPFKLFDKEGKFLHDIGSVGNGAGEYAISIYDEVIDEKNDRIFLSPFYGRKIMVYGTNGKWIKDIPLPGQINKPKLSLNADGTLSVVHMPFQEGEPLAFQVDMEGNILKQIPATAKRTVSDFNGEVFSYKNGNGFDFFHTSIDTLFIYDPVGNRLLPEFTMTFPNPEEKPIHLYYRLPNHFMVNYYFWGKNGPENSGDILIDKKKNASSHFRLINDFYGNLPISGTGHNFYQGYFIQNMEPGQLAEQIEKHLASGKCPSQDRKKLEELAATLDENDNNVLFVGKVKK